MEQTEKLFQYDGRMKEGMDCPKCISKQLKEKGQLRFISGSQFSTVVVFGCTKCDFRQTAYDTIGMSLGIF